ncbi:hypothetical protein CLOM_g9451 [Closterium sp. NIES-68]|nr:hypothetical protein CLOM_g9451 [Closterium sp. NIES-68]GJP75787.1 hypothetical protein CLOP_g6188 [Closterium sp. NIES-67]
MNFSMAHSAPLPALPTLAPSCSTPPSPHITSLVYTAVNAATAVWSPAASPRCNSTRRSRFPRDIPSLQPSSRYSHVSLQPPSCSPAPSRTSLQSYSRVLSSRASSRRQIPLAPVVAARQVQVSSEPRRVAQVDPGRWDLSPEWWGTQAGGWGRGPGDEVFLQRSDWGNGTVTVTSHPASDEGAEEWGEGGGVRTLRHEWRVLRFNDATRQSVARVSTVAVDVTVDGERGVTTGRGGEGGAAGKWGGEGERRRVVLQRQQPNCLAFEYLKSMAAAALTSCHLHQPHLLASSEAPPRLHVLCLGLGGGSLPLFLANTLPSALIDAVEIDPAVITAATQHMGFPAWAVRATPQSCSGPKAAADALAVDQEAAAAAAVTAAERLLWHDVYERVAVYNEDAVSFVARAAEQIGDQADGEGRWEPYDLVLVDVFDGSDETPPELLDRNGPFLRALARVVHPRHGTLVMNVHADVPSPSLWERVTGRFSDGWADESTERGRRIHTICRAYSSALLDATSPATPPPHGTAFTVSTAFQGNMTLVVQRGMVLGEGDGKGEGEEEGRRRVGGGERRGGSSGGGREEEGRKGELEARLKEAAAELDERGVVPFAVAPRVVRGLKVLPREWVC